MVNAREEQPLTRLEVLVLARASISKALKEDEVSKTVFDLALSRESMARAREVALETIAALRARGLVKQRVPRTRKGNIGSKVLTEEGRRALRTAFGLARAPTWSEVRDRHLPALAFGIKPGSEQAKQAVGSQDAIAATVLRKKLGVPHAPTVAALCDALIAEMLGMPPGELSLGKIRAHVLAQRAGVEPKGEPGDIAARVVAVELQARGSNKDAFDEALGRRWVREAADAPGVAPSPAQPATQLTNGHARAPAPSGVHTPPPVQDPPTRSAQPIAAVSSAATGSPHRAPAPADASALLLQMVREAIPRVGEQGRFGDEKVFVSALWHDIARDRRIGGLTLDRFKRWLVMANRDGTLVLTRADLAAEMDTKLVADSEIEDQGATFHCVIDPRSGAAASERRNHVR